MAQTESSRRSRRTFAELEPSRILSMIGMINRTISHYRIDKQLGTGGMGEVYLATDIRLNRAVAIKVLPTQFAADPHRLKRFAREAQAASALNHPNVGHIYEIDEFEGQPFIVMEYVPGKTLAGVLQERKLDTDEILSIAVQIMDALDKAHSLGIIHRDIKPNNILITDANQVKVVDFGLSKILQREQSDSNVATASETELGTVLGTVPYMSPEQALGKKVDARTDLFSLGTVLYEMATSRRPFSGTTATATIEEIAHAQPEAISRFNYNIPLELERIVRKCLEKNPENRYQSAHEALIDLRNLKRDLHSPVAAPASKSLHRLFAAAVALLLLGLFVIWFAKSSPFRKQTTEGPQRIAVLPFQLLTTGNDINYLSVGIADSIITRLSNIRQIRLSPTDAILRFQNQQMDLKKVQHELKADGILTGTIQKGAGRFRISVQMVRATDGVTMWAEQYDLAPEDLLKLEDEIADRVSRSLKISLTTEDRERIYRRYTQNSAAYNSYLHGRSELTKYNSDGVRAAVSDFENCLKLDPNYALARAGLALASAEMHLRYAPASEVKEWGVKAKTEAEKALQLDPNLAEAHEALAGVYRKTEFNWDQTIQESRKALDLNPSLELPHYYLAASLYHLGLLELASKEVQAGLDSGGTNRTEAFRTQGVIALISGNYPEAVSKLEEAQRISGKPLADAYLIHAYYAMKKIPEANSLIEQLSHSSSASAVSRSLAARAAFLADAGDSENAKKMADSVANGPYMDHHVAYDLGTAYGLLHQDQEALLWLRRSIDSGLPCYPLFAQDPLLRKMESNPEFRKLLGELRDKWQSAHEKYER